MEQKTKKKERVYGEDTGCIGQEDVNHLKELLEKDPKRAELWVYFVFNDLDTMCYNFNRVLPGGRELIPHNEKTWREYHEINYARHWAIAQTSHFGVTFEPKVKGRAVYMSDSFIRWYNFWHEYIEGLPRAKWDELNKAFSYDGDITPYLPEKAWNEE